MIGEIYRTKIKHTKLNGKSIEVSEDIKFYDHNNEKLSKAVRINMDFLGYKNMLLTTVFDDKLINTYEKPYDLVYNEKQDMIIFTFYRNTYDIVSEYDLAYVVQLLELLATIFIKAAV